MAGSSDPGFDTLALHAGAAPDPATGARAVPIHLSTSFVFRSSEHAASLFNMEASGHVYSRISNPTNAVLEQRVAALEGGVAALALSSGQAASAFAVQNIAKAGDNIVSSTDLYGGTWTLDLLPCPATEPRRVRGFSWLQILKRGIYSNPQYAILHLSNSFFPQTLNSSRSAYASHCRTEPEGRGG